ncbi:hypothetical protein BJX61DRAFT_521626 [Aspergillus egyptiacus]|nr:hypothetical protein BJX61DRAFT_521626 [Aspergillus egyptiacus]
MQGPDAVMGGTDRSTTYVRERLTDGACTGPPFINKTHIGLIREEDVPVFEQIFQHTCPRPSEVFVFRFMDKCVELKLVEETERTGSVVAEG